MSEDKRTKRKRYAPSADPLELERRTRAECERRFVAVWGMPLMRRPYEKAPEMLRLIAGFWEGEESNKATEDEARALLGELRAIMTKIDDYKKRTPHGAGGVASLYLQIECHGVPPSPGELERALADAGQRLSRREGRSALVERFGGPVPHVGRELLDGELAVISILLGIGPGSYAALLPKLTTPAEVIHYEAKAIAACRRNRR